MTATLDQGTVPGAGMWRTWPALFVMWLAVAGASGQEPAHPLKPPDRSSPRAALKTFLDSGDAVGAFLAAEYLPAPSRAKFHQLRSLAEATVQCLDLSDLPPAARQKASGAAALALYDTLNRIQLPPLDAIPGGDMPRTGTNAPRWVIPNTEIAFERVTGGPRSGEYLFSADTVVRAGEFYKKVSDLPYTRPVALANIREILTEGSGWWISYQRIQALPGWLRAHLGGQAAWKWIALGLVLVLFTLFLLVAFRLSHRGSPERPFRQALAQLLLPVSVLLAAPAFAYLALLQINLFGGVAPVVAMAAAAIMYLAGAWIAWRFAPVVAEAVIASPNIPTESIDAHLIRICTRLLGMVAGAALLAVGADRLGLPVYGIIAGLGVGGLAIALAAQPTVENLIGGFTLFADKPIRVGDSCRCGSNEGTVESIGIRSTRIRGGDRTLTTIPNADLSKMSVVNFAQRDRMQIKSVVGVRYETSPEQLRYLLVKIREMLQGHPRIHPDSAGARFVGFGASSLDIEVSAFAVTRNGAEFLSIREDILLRIMDLVAQSGTGFAFPSQTLYFARDEGPDAERTKAAEAAVRQWRQEGRLPFTEYPAEHAKESRSTVAAPSSLSSGPTHAATVARDSDGKSPGQTAPVPQTGRQKKPTA